MSIILVNELFGPTYQGEGKSIGMPCVFLRLSSCNLFCSWCDTPYTWNWEGTRFSHPQKFSKAKEAHKVNDKDLLRETLILCGKHDIKKLVLTGGEPLLQQTKLYEFLKGLKEAGFWIEVETNGTILPTETFAKYVDQFNCSPKLANSDVPERRRLVARVLKLVAQGSKFNFKFVVSQYADGVEIKKLVDTYNLQQVWIMPEGSTREEHIAREHIAAHIAKENGWNFSRRAHILEHDNKRGV